MRTNCSAPSAGTGSSCAVKFQAPTCGASSSCINQLGVTRAQLEAAPQVIRQKDISIR